MSHQPALPLPAATPGRAGHPAGLKILFFTEMWERFSYYGMRALLVLYLVNALGYQRGDALELYGIYTGLVYLTPMIGGFIADRFLGMRRAAVIGGAIMMLGHFAMAFEPLLHVALGLLILGNGMFKPNTTSMVGALYAGEDDPRRAGGYTYFYMGINVGSFLSGVVAGTLGEVVGWHWGFASAGVGMAFGVFTLLSWQRLLDRAGLKPEQGPLGWQDLLPTLAWCAGATALVVCTLQAWALLGPLLAGVPFALKSLVAVGIVGALLWLPTRFGQQTQQRTPLTAAERGRVVAIGIVCLFVITFWMGFEQGGGSMNLFADKQTDRHAFGFEIPATWFQSINPLVIVLLAPAFSALWTRLDQTRFALSDVAKQGLGMIVLGLGFVVMAQAQSLADSAGKVGPQWLVIVYVLHTTGELMLSPVGLSMVSRLAPRQIAAMLMGVWFLANAIANYLAGALERLLAGSGIPPFAFLMASSIGAGIVLLLLSPALNRLMHRQD